LGHELDLWGQLVPNLYLTVFKIFAFSHNWVTTLTFWGHATLSLMWPFDPPYPISYSSSIVTKCVSPAVFEILGLKHNWVTTLTFLGHVTSPVTCASDSPYAISY